MLADPANVAEVGSALTDAAATATDLLLVYYAGHGLVDNRGRLHLALVDTQPHHALWTSVSFDSLREELATSAAGTRVLVLDCCFSGRAIESMTDTHGIISGQLDVAGTYTLTSTTANALSYAPVGDRHTAFTGALLRALKVPIRSPSNRSTSRLTATLRHGICPAHNAAPSTPQGSSPSPVVGRPPTLSVHVRFGSQDTGGRCAPGRPVLGSVRR